jgi:hypothetical protein
LQLQKGGSKKDFYDVFQLGKTLGPKKIIENFSAKYGEDKLWMMQLGLAYFEDAENEADPELIRVCL